MTTRMTMSFNSFFCFRRAINTASRSSMTLIVLMLILVAPPAASQPHHKTVSIPARIFLQHLKTRGIEPVIRQRIAGQRWIAARSPGSTSSCAISDNGVFTARRISIDTEVLSCELTLFEPGFTLPDNWKVQRVHWTGDINQARFIANPVGNSRPYIKLELDLPSARKSNSTGKVGSNQISMQLVTLRGPADKSWQQVF